MEEAPCYFFEVALLVVVLVVAFLVSAPRFHANEPSRVWSVSRGVAILPVYSTEHAVAVRKFPQHSRYEEIADRLTREAERNAEVSTYISAEDVAEALGDEDYDPDNHDTYQALLKWIEKRRMLGHDPCADDIINWIETEAP